MSVLSRRLRETRRRLGLKQGELAEKLGVTQGTISRWETTVDPDFNAMLHVAQLAGYDPVSFAVDETEHPFQRPDDDWGITVQVVGGIEEDFWVESPEWDLSQQFQIRIPTLPLWNGLKIEGFVIKDKSAEPYYAKRSVLFIADQIEGILEIKHEDYVVVQRTDDRGLYEITLRQCYINQHGEVYLSSLSEDPSVGRPFKIKNAADRTGGQGIESIVKLPPEAIRGLVVASFRIEDARRFTLEPD